MVLEVCLCQTHTNFRNCCNALCEIAHDAVSDFPEDYAQFLIEITKDCGVAPETDKMLPWTCVEGRTYCPHVSERVQSLKASVKDHVDLRGPRFLRFEKYDEGKLQDYNSKETIQFMIEYLEQRLAKFLLHRNHLSYYRSSCPEYIQSHGNMSYHMDFSENLSLPLKYEVQSKYWSKKQVTVHTGVLRHVSGDLKIYHSVLSDDKTHDQVFVKNVMDQILIGMTEADCSQDEALMAVSDNCSGQYKSAQHFHDLQLASTLY